MAHELTIRSGKAEMAYVGQTPWHGLGQELKEDASIEEWQTAAGMNWRILRSKVRYNTVRDGGADQFCTMDDRHVLFRSDDRSALSVVSDEFKTVQPKAVLEFFRELTDTAGFKMETAGTMFGGRRFWALASTGESAFIVDPKDRVKGYVLLSTSCDGSMATEARYTNVRVVCHNTLSAARGEAARVKVTHRSTFKADDVKKELGIEMAHEAFAKTMDQFRAMVNAELQPHDAMMQTAMLFEPKASDMAKDDLVKLLHDKRIIRIGELAIDNMAIGGNLAGVAGSQWGWLNAVTQFVDHEARARSVDNRISSAWFGKGDDLKTRAFEMALAGSTTF
jgi:phage/plasmid-like protein (TIGR03299 family)